MTELHVSPGTDQRQQPASRAGHGWLAFAGIMFIAAAAVSALWGVAALANDDHFAVDELLFADLSLWGVIYLAFAALCAVTGFLILRGNEVGAVLGAMLALLHGCSALLSIGAYPLWTVVVLVIDGLIIYALVVHGPDEPRGV
jgi:hypothetical protein